MVCTLVSVTKIHVSEHDKNSVFYFLFYPGKSHFTFSVAEASVMVVVDGLRLMLPDSSPDKCSQ